MALNTADRAKVIKEYQINDKDTASPQVQIALITERLGYLNRHFKENKKDNHSRRGLMKLVGRRRSLLDYLNAKDPSAYKTLITKLGIRK